MRPELLEFMKCPYCDGNLNVSEAVKTSGEDIITGIVNCECDEWPILEGILMLRAHWAKKSILDAIKEGPDHVLPPLKLYLEDAYRFQDFLKSSSAPAKIGAKAFINFVEWRNKRLYMKYSKRNSYFSELLDNKGFDLYLKHRFSSETFWSIYPFIHLLKAKKERVLDLGCGAGHGSFVISQYVNPEELICCDRSFRNLYLAKRYFAPNAQFIALDANYPLPFKQGVFSSILTMDSLHYVQARSSCIGELQRILAPSGLLLGLHLHNSLVYNRAAGYPLSPQGWINLFKGINPKIFPERKLVEDFLFEGKLDLSKSYSEEELSSSNALCIAASNDNGFFRNYLEADSDLLNNKTNLVINPIYEIKHKKDKIVLKRPPAFRACSEEVPVTEKTIPKEIAVRKDILAKNNRQMNIAVNSASENTNYIEKLMKQFVLINIPNRFERQG